MIKNRPIDLPRVKTLIETWERMERRYNVEADRARSRGEVINAAVSGGWADAMRFIIRDFSHEIRYIVEEARLLPEYEEGPSDHES